MGAASASFAGGGPHVAVALTINAEALVALEEKAGGKVRPATEGGLAAFLAEE
jgi:hypothetical protein